MIFSFFQKNRVFGYSRSTLLGMLQRGGSVAVADLVMPGDWWNVTGDTWYMSRVTCHMSRVTCNFFLFFYTFSAPKKLSVLWSALVERFSVSRMRDFFFIHLWRPPPPCTYPPLSKLIIIFCCLITLFRPIFLKPFFDPFLAYPLFCN